MIIGSLLYVLYIASLIKVYKALVIVASIFIGFGAAILWIAQGAFLTKCSSHETRGFYSGLFWTIFQTSNIFGNLSAYFLLPHLTPLFLFSTFTATALLGSLVLLLLQPVSPVKDPVPSPLLDEGTLSETPLFLLKKTLLLFSDLKMVMILPMCFWTGFEAAFWTGEFPLLLTPEIIGLVLAVIGIAEFLVGILLGKFSDLVGRVPIVFLGSAVYALGLLITGLARIPSTSFSSLHQTLWGVPEWSFLAAIGFGIGDCVFNTQVYAALGDFYGDGSVGGFTLFQLFQNVGAAIGYFYGINYPVHGSSGTLVQLWVQYTILGLSMATFSIGITLHKQKPSIVVIQE